MTTPPETVTSNQPSFVQPPGYRGLARLAALPSLIADPLAFLSKAVATHGGVVDFGRVGRRNVFLLAEPDAIQRVLVENHRNYTKGSQFKAMRLLTGDGLVTAEGERWQRQRRLIQPAFLRERVLEATDAIVAISTSVLEQWSVPPEGRWIDVFPEMTILARRLLLRVILGVQSAGQADEIGRAWEDAFAFLTSRLLSPIALPVDLPTPGNLRFRRALRVLDDAIREIIEARRVDSSEGGVLPLLLAARDEVTGAPMNDRELRDEVMTFFAGGFESSATALTWALHLLSTHPEVFKRLQAETAEVLGDRPPNRDDVGRLRYSMAVVAETLRIYPIAWIFVRESIQADRLCGYHIPPHSTLVVCPYATHRLSVHWSRPLVFDPDRFVHDSQPKRHRFAYLPFGGGPRKCIGDGFALAEVQLVLTLIAQRFSLTAREHVDVRPKAMATLRPQSGPVIRFVPRNSRMG